MTPELCVLLGLARRYEPALAETLRSIGGLQALAHAGTEPFVDRLPAAALSRLEALIAILGHAEAPKVLPARISSAEDVRAMFGERMRNLPEECFYVLCLDARGRPIAQTEVARGTLTACLVHPREVFAPAIRARAAQIAVVHNHPSGDPEPSEDDLALTERLLEASEILGIPLVDHVIIAASGYRSIGGAEPKSRGSALHRPRSA